MSGPLGGEDAAGATPLTHEDLDGLIPTFVATRGDLNLAEQSNIEAASSWAFTRRRVTTPARLFTIEFADRLHRQMFADVWTWAGKHRTRMTNIGVEPRHSPRLHRGSAGSRPRRHPSASPLSLTDEQWVVSNAPAQVTAPETIHRHVRPAMAPQDRGRGLRLRRERARPGAPDRGRGSGAVRRDRRR